MKAAYLETTGAPEVIKFGELTVPNLGTGQIMVRVKAAALNPIDVYIRAGTVKMPLPSPFITGTDFAGVVEMVGSGCKRFKPGDRVWGSNRGVLGRQGTCAELICVDENYAYPIPEGIRDQEAAGAALVGITAHLGLFRWARLQPGEIVFVNGGTGGVGSMVVQMAKAIGAHVITTVGSPNKVALCQSWGADRVLNYKTDDVPTAVREFTGGAGVHVWYETQREPDFVRTVELLRPRGRMVIMAGRTAQPLFPVGPFYVKDLSLFGFVMFNATAAEQQVCAEDLNRWLREKKLRVPIGKTFPLPETAQAHRFLEDNTLHKAGTLTGKVVIEV